MRQTHNWNKLPALVLCVTAALCCTAAAQESEQSWPIAELARRPGPSIELKDSRGTVIGRLKTSQVLLIDGVYRGICDVAEACPRFLLIPGSTPNALAAPVGPGGTVMINLAITRLIGYDASQWAAVLGHEVAHLKLDHVSERMAVSLPMELAEAILRQSTNSGYGILAGEYGRQLIETTFSREQEHESDYLGAIWALEAGFEVEGAARLQKNLLKQYGEQSQLPFLRSHPTSQDRIRRLESLAERLTPDR
jgi:Zn-dependent protease with chaperone function